MGASGEGISCHPMSPKIILVGDRMRNEERTPEGCRKVTSGFCLSDLTSLPRACPNCLRLKEQVKDTMPKRKYDGQIRQGGD